LTPRPLKLDYLAARKPGLAGAALLALSLGVAAFLFSQFHDARAELARLQAMAELAGPPRRPAAIPKERMDDEVKRAEAVVRSLALPWADLIRSVEQAAMRDVSLLQLEPNPDARVVKLTGEARSREAMFQYLRRLGAASGIAEVHLVSHQVQRDNPRRPLQFSVQAAMRTAK
jgi:hypothetical protein